MTCTTKRAARGLLTVVLAAAFALPAAAQQSTGGTGATGGTAATTTTTERRDDHSNWGWLGLLGLAGLLGLRRKTDERDISGRTSTATR